MENVSEYTKELLQMIQSFQSSIVDTLLNGDTLPFNPDSSLGIIFIILAVWEFSDILLKFMDSSQVDTKRIMSFIISFIVVLMVHGKFNVNAFPGMIIYDHLPSQYHYKANGKPDLLRHSHAIGRAIFDNMGAGFEKSVNQQTSTVVMKAKTRVLISQICDERNDKDSCYKELKTMSYKDLKEKRDSENKCGSSAIPGKCFFEDLSTSFQNYASAQGITILILEALGYVKLLFIALIYLTFALTVVIAIFSLKIISIFLILSKTRPDIIASYKYLMSTSAFYFAVNLIRFIMASAALAVGKAMDNGSSGLVGYLIGGIFAIVLLIGEVGLLWFVPNLTSSLFNLQLSALTKLGDQMKSTLSTSVSILGSVSTGGLLAGMGGFLAKANAMGMMKDKAAGMMSKGKGGSPMSKLSGGSPSGGGPPMNSMRSGPSGAGMGGLKDSVRNVSAENATIENSPKPSAPTPMSASNMPSDKTALEALEKRKQARLQEQSNKKGNTQRSPSSIPKDTSGPSEVGGNVGVPSAKLPSIGGKGLNSADSASELIKRNKAKKQGATAKSTSMANMKNIAKATGVGALGATKGTLKAGFKGTKIAAKVAGAATMGVLDFMGNDSLGGLSGTMKKNKDRLKSEFVDPQKKERAKRVENNMFGEEKAGVNWEMNEEADFDSKEKENIRSLGETIESSRNKISESESSLKELEGSLKSQDAHSLEYYRVEKEIEEAKERLTSAKASHGEHERELKLAQGNWGESLDNISNKENLKANDIEKIKSMMDDGVIDKDEREQLNQILGNEQAQKLMANNQKKLDNINKLIDNEMSKHGRMSNPVRKKITKMTKGLSNSEIQKIKEQVEFKKNKRGQ